MKKTILTAALAAAVFVSSAATASAASPGAVQLISSGTTAVTPEQKKAEADTAVTQAAAITGSAVSADGAAVAGSLAGSSVASDAAALASIVAGVETASKDAAKTEAQMDKDAKAAIKAMTADEKAALKTEASDLGKSEEETEGNYLKADAAVADARTLTLGKDGKGITVNGKISDLTVKIANTASADEKKAATEKFAKLNPNAKVIGTFGLKTGTYNPLLEGAKVAKTIGISKFDTTKEQLVAIQKQADGNYKKIRNFIT